VVVSDPHGRLIAAPLFVVSAEATFDQVSGQWTLTSKSDPDINVALMSGRVFDPAIGADIDASLNGTLQFGHRATIVQQIDTIASVLGLECFDINGLTLNTSLDNVPGVYNCALVLDGSDKGAFHDLLREIKELSHRTDWKDTAAALLVSSPRSAAMPRLQWKVSPVCGSLWLNRTQEDAASKARLERLTVVTGPPGTGKSQLVVGAVVNAWVDHETVLVTSTNNGAVDVAVSRADDITSGLLLRTGHKYAREALPALVSQTIKHYQDKPPSYVHKGGEPRSRLARAQARRTDLHNKFLQAEELDARLTATVGQIEELASRIWTHTERPQNLESLGEIAHRCLRLSKTIFFRRARLLRLFRNLHITLSLDQADLVNEWARLVASYLDLREQTELTYRQDLIDPDTQLRTTDDEWLSASFDLLTFEVHSSIGRHPAAFAQIGNTGGGGGKLPLAINYARRSLKGWACTTLSMSRNFNLEAGYFDLVIIDEASQCNVAYILPVAYRAKRLLVVGDPNQLSPIVQVGENTVDSITDLVGIRHLIHSNPGLDYKRGSAYAAFESAKGVEDVLLLDEHYRCHPRIARWFNETFYGNLLTVMTDVSRMTSTHRGISWVDVDGNAVRPQSQRSWVNVAEADEVVKAIQMLLGKGLTIGVVAPFAAQAAAIGRLTEIELGADVLADIDFTSGTAHRFQGDERDVIIFSSCVAPGISEHAAKWVEKERNLINVAVSRARQQLIVIGSPWIAKLKCPTLSSLRAFSKDVDGDGGRVGHMIASESERRLLDAMIASGLSPLSKVEVEGFELDFALIFRQFNIDIEVDGDQHFDARRHQRRQDVYRDRVLRRAGWTVLRYPAWRCFLEPQQVVTEIREYLRNLH
jgi:very-short-patch-repair endonuclease